MGTPSIILNIMTLIQHCIIRESIREFVLNTKFNFEITWSSTVDEVTKYGNQTLSESIDYVVKYVSNTKFRLNDIICSILVRNGNHIQGTFIRERSFFTERASTVEGFQQAFRKVFENAWWGPHFLSIFFKKNDITVVVIIYKALLLYLL